ncbi:MAG: surface protein, partial [uncultured bacterium]
MNKIKYFLVVLSFLIVGQAKAAFYDPYYEVRTVKTEHFYIHYPRQVSSAAKDLMDIVEKVHAKLAVKMKWNPWGRTHVVLVDKTDFANGLATVIPANYLLLYVSPPDA